MASCFKCAVLDGNTNDVESIGVCKACYSLACIDHGTRLRAGSRFECVLCLPTSMRTSANVVIHDTYSPLPPGTGGGTQPTAGAPGDPSGGGAREFASSADFASKEPRIARCSSEHRTAARSIVDPLVNALAATAGDDTALASLVQKVVVTSDEATVAYATARMKEVSIALKTASLTERLDRDLLADALGVGAWAVGAALTRGGTQDLGIEEIPADRAAHVSDPYTQILLGVWSRQYSRAMA